jgi:hypothetical protein
MPATVRFDDFSRGHAGDVDRSRATKGQWFGRDVMLYIDGLVGPRPPIRPIALTPIPTIVTPPIDGMLWEQGGGAYVLAIDAVFKIVAPLADFANPRTVNTMGLVSSGFALAADTPPAPTNPRALVSRVLAQGGAGIVSYDSVTNAGVAVVTPTDTSEMFVRWNERFVFANANRIYYSNAADPLTWPAANTYTVGDGGAITALIPSPLALYVAKASGWWVITGVLGSTATIRQVAERQGVEPAGSAANQAGTRVVASWDQGMLWMRRRYQAGAPDEQGTEPPNSQASELVTFTGALMRPIATVYATNLARLVGLPVGAALIDLVNRGIDTAVRVSLLDGNGRLSSHDFSSLAIPTGAVPAPLWNAEGGNGATGYEPDHLLLAYRTVGGQMALAAWRYRTSRPGYGSDLDKSPGWSHANVVGTFSPPDWWSEDGRQVSVSAVTVQLRVYDTSKPSAGPTVDLTSTARLRCRVQALGREAPATSALSASTQQEYVYQVDVGIGDHDRAVRFDVTDAGRGMGFRVELELENVAVRAVYVHLEEAAPLR